MTHQRAIQIVKNYIYDLKEPTNEWRIKQFESRSTAIWAANEVLRLIISHPDESVFDLIECLAKKFDRYSMLDEKTSYIFSSAYDITMDILDLFYAYEP